MVSKNSHLNPTDYAKKPIDAKQVSELQEIRKLHPEQWDKLTQEVYRKGTVCHIINLQPQEDEMLESIMQKLQTDGV